MPCCSCGSSKNIEDTIDFKITSKKKNKHEKDKKKATQSKKSSKNMHTSSKTTDSIEKSTNSGRSTPRSPRSETSGAGNSDQSKSTIEVSQPRKLETIPELKEPSIITSTILQEKEVSTPIAHKEKKVTIISPKSYSPLITRSDKDESHDGSLRPSSDIAGSDSSEYTYEYYTIDEIDGDSKKKGSKNTTNIAEKELDELITPAEKDLTEGAGDRCRGYWMNLHLLICPAHLITGSDSSEYTYEYYTIDEIDGDSKKKGSKNTTNIAEKELDELITPAEKDLTEGAGGEPIHESPIHPTALLESALVDSRSDKDESHDGSLRPSSDIAGSDSSEYTYEYYTIDEIDGDSKKKGSKNTTNIAEKELDELITPAEKDLTEGAGGEPIHESPIHPTALLESALVDSRRPVSRILDESSPPHMSRSSHHGSSKRRRKRKKGFSESESTTINTHSHGIHPSDFYGSPSKLDDRFDEDNSLGGLVIQFSAVRKGDIIQGNHFSANPQATSGHPSTGQLSESQLSPIELGNPQMVDITSDKKSPLPSVESRQRDKYREQTFEGDRSVYDQSSDLDSKNRSKYKYRSPRVDFDREGVIQVSPSSRRTRVPSSSVAQTPILSPVKKYSSPSQIRYSPKSTQSPLTKQRSTSSPIRTTPGSAGKRARKKTRAIKVLHKTLSPPTSAECLLSTEKGEVDELGDLVRALTEEHKAFISPHTPSKVFQHRTQQQSQFFSPASPSVRSSPLHTYMDEKGGSTKRARSPARQKSSLRANIVMEPRDDFDQDEMFHSIVNNGNNTAGAMDPSEPASENVRGPSFQPMAYSDDSKPINRWSHNPSVPSDMHGRSPRMRRSVGPHGLIGGSRKSEIDRKRERVLQRKKKLQSEGAMRSSRPWREAVPNVSRLPVSQTQLRKERMQRELEEREREQEERERQQYLASMYPPTSHAHHHEGISYNVWGSSNNDYDGYAHSHPHHVTQSPYHHRTALPPPPLSHPYQGRSVQDGTSSSYPLSKEYLTQGDNPVLDAEIKREKKALKRISMKNDMLSLSQVMDTIERAATIDASPKQSYSLLYAKEKFEESKKERDYRLSEERKRERELLMRDKERKEQEQWEQRFRLTTTKAKSPIRDYTMDRDSYIGRQYSLDSPIIGSSRNMDMMGGNIGHNSPGRAIWTKGTSPRSQILGYEHQGKDSHILSEDLGFSGSLSSHIVDSTKLTPKKKKKRMKSALSKQHLPTQPLSTSLSTSSLSSSSSFSFSSSSGVLSSRRNLKKDVEDQQYAWVCQMVDEEKRAKDAVQKMKDRRDQFLDQQEQEFTPNQIHCSEDTIGQYEPQNEYEYEMEEEMEGEEEEEEEEEDEEEEGLKEEPDKARPLDDIHKVLYVSVDKQRSLHSSNPQQSTQESSEPQSNPDLPDHPKPDVGIVPVSPPSKVIPIESHSNVTEHHELYIKDAQSSSMLSSPDVDERKSSKPLARSSSKKQLASSPSASFSLTRRESIDAGIIDPVRHNIQALAEQMEEEDDDFGEVSSDLLMKVKGKSSVRKDKRKGSIGNESGRRSSVDIGMLNRTSPAALNRRESIDAGIIDPVRHNIQALAEQMEEEDDDFGEVSSDLLMKVKGKSSVRKDKRKGSIGNESGRRSSVDIGMLNRTSPAALNRSPSRLSSSSTVHPSPLRHSMTLTRSSHGKLLSGSSSGGLRSPSRPSSRSASPARYPIDIKMSSSTDAVIQTVEHEFVHEGDKSCCPIPLDAPNIRSADLLKIKAIDGTKKKGRAGYDLSSKAQKIMKGEGNDVNFTHISIPFSSASPMKGAYICLWDYFDSDSPPSHLIFTLTSSKGERTSKRYKFHEFYGDHWCFLPVDLPDVVLCEITGKGRRKESFGIKSLVFFREETPEEIAAREAREKLWSEAPVVKPEFVQEGDEESFGRDSIPIPRDDPKLVDPSFSMVKCKDNSVSYESRYYDKSLGAQRMLKGEDFVSLSHLSIPFPSPSPLKGACICVDWGYSSPSLLFTFTDCDGKKTCKKYEFTKLKHYYEWHFLPIDLDNVVLCEIEGKGRWGWKNCQCFYIYSLVFTLPEETIAAERLSLLPWK
ncbi:hypothetical protein ADUPG1_012451 [Aduncisulcus paluster]|uniref:Uncharacterized protein n=1 Tax=Aduncisulcus paluster TaxID=2918883 RepID=A0ABQ5K1D3_9EUKA|nr:hypothetical protein ADUPG1_012451 [Aduncisulcus paluster]